MGCVTWLTWQGPHGRIPPEGFVMDGQPTRTCICSFQIICGFQIVCGCSLIFLSYPLAGPQPPTPISTARASSHHPSFKSLKWLYVAQTLSWNSAHRFGLGVLAGLCLSISSGWVHSHLCQRCSLMESSISWQTLSSVSASQGLLLGSLCSWYMSLYTPLFLLWLTWG